MTEAGEETRAGDRKRPAGFREVAERAGVSVSSVERVMNDRANVSAVTRAKVLAAAEGLGLRRILPGPHIGNLRIEAILPANKTEYWAKLSQGLKETAKLLPRGITLNRTFVAENNPAAMVEAIARSAGRRAALIVAAEVDPEVENSLAKVMRRGEIVVSVSTMMRNLPLHAFSGIDNMAAGRTAAALIDFALRKTAGRVLVLQGNATLQSHLDRIAGFRERLDGRHTIELAITHEVSGASWRHLSSMLLEGRIPSAIYETGDSGREIAPLLRRLDEKPVWIGHERNAAHEELLREGLLDFVLDQDPAEQARWALGCILSKLGIASAHLANVRKPELRLFCATNLGD